MAGLGLWKGVANFKVKTIGGPAGVDYAPRLPRLCPHHRAYRSRDDHLGTEQIFGRDTSSFATSVPVWHSRRQPILLAARRQSSKIA